MVEVKLSERLTCKAKVKKGKVCGYSWLPRSTHVYRCPKCMSFRWDEDDAGNKKVMEKPPESGRE